jgi:hypothetical protein
LGSASTVNQYGQGPPTVGSGGNTIIGSGLSRARFVSTVLACAVSLGRDHLGEHLAYQVGLPQRHGRPGDPRAERLGRGLGGGQHVDLGKHDRHHPR